MEYPILGRVIPPIIGLWVKKVEGLENIPKEGNFIIAANHASYIDHLILSSMIVTHTGKRVHYLAKKEHFDSTFQRMWHKHTGAIPVDRQHGGQEALNIAVDFLKAGKIIGIYPEGTRTLTGELQKGKTGIARLVLATGVSVLPVGLKGTFEILPKGKKLPRFKRANIKIGKLMKFGKSIGKVDDKETLRKVTDLIMKEIAILCGKKYGY